MNVVDANNQRMIIMSASDGNNLNRNNNATKEAQSALEARLKEAIAERQETEVGACCSRPAEVECRHEIIFVQSLMVYFTNVTILYLSMQQYVLTGMFH